MYNISYSGAYTKSNLRYLQWHNPKIKIMTHLGDDSLRVGRYPPWEVWLIMTDGIEEIIFVFPVEWRLANYHLVKQNTK